MYIYLEINLRRMINYIFHNSKRESYVERESYIYIERELQRGGGASVGDGARPANIRELPKPMSDSVPWVACTVPCCIRFHHPVNLLSLAWQLEAGQKRPQRCVKRLPLEVVLFTKLFQNFQVQRNVFTQILALFVIIFVVVVYIIISTRENKNLK